GAMLAASGIGALLSPPTLGAAAFLIAEYLRVSYLQVLIMATIPTVLYYTSIVLMIEGDAPSSPPALSAASPNPSVSPPALPAASAPISPRAYLHFTSLFVVAL